MERRFLDFSLPGSVCSTGAKVLSMDFSLPGTKVQRNEKARYHVDNADTTNYSCDADADNGN